MLRLLLLTLGAALLLLSSGCGLLTKLPLMAGLPLPQRDPGLGRAEDFAFQTLDGRAASLSQYAGQPVVLNFWADW